MEGKVYTITYGDVAENHARMQKIGTLHDRGYSIELLEKVAEKLQAEGLEVEIVRMNMDIAGGSDAKAGGSVAERAAVLVIRKGVQHILGSTKELIEENDRLEKDKKALMRGRVVNKHARWNLCFGDEDQEPAYEDGRGRIVGWHNIPLMQRIRSKIAEWTEDVELNAEANYYYDISKCGIGFHGDGERRKVFAMRMGESMPIYYKWFKNSEAISEPIEIMLNDGDMYMMSEKAVGFDWLKKKVATLRHATGCRKYTGV
jgi:hypothetical protein